MTGEEIEATWATLVADLRDRRDEERLRRELLEPEDGSNPWDRGLILTVVGRHIEAADDYLVAGALARGGYPAAAATLASRLSPEDREQVEALLGAPS